MEEILKTVLFSLLLLTCAPLCIYSDDRLLVNMTLVRNASAIGAYCLDGSLPAYHIHRGFGAGVRNWLLQFEGGGWCNDLNSCLDRANTRRGSTRYMGKMEVFSGILSDNASRNPGTLVFVTNLDSRSLIRTPISGVNGYCYRVPQENKCPGDECSEHPEYSQQRGALLFGGAIVVSALIIYLLDFYNWNRVKIRYCDGASFAGDAIFDNGTSLLYFRGQRIWQAIILDLLPKGLCYAKKALLSGCSAGGLAVFLHCDNFTSYLPPNASVKCLSDAGFFLDARDIMLNHTIRTFYEDLISLQGVVNNLDKNCTFSCYYPEQCFFPQYALRYIRTPLFILNSAYDVYQFHHIFVPPSADPHGHWNHCKLNPTACTPSQIHILQGLRNDMLAALRFFFEFSRRGGMFINSCFAHCQSELQDTWFAADSPRVHNKTIAEAVGDWYFGRNVTKEIDCAYPCGTTCHNLIG